VARRAILTVLLSKTPKDVSEDEIANVASRAHGYVGADLAAVVREAGTRAIKRWLGSTTGLPFTSPTKLSDVS
jgi:AAA family ATPase